MTREEQLISDIKTLIHTEKFIEQHVVIYNAIKDLIKIYDAEMEKIER